MRRAGELEYRRLSETFAELCRIPSPFGKEAACAQHVAGELSAFGLEVVQDDTAATSGGECGNVIARIPGGRSPGILFCAHLDTVPLAAPVDPVVIDDGWENANDGILGADNKAAVAVLLVAAQRYAREPPPVDVELLFTVSEENALAGAKAFDASTLRSKFGYVFDHASAIGEVVTASPTYYRLEATFHGAAAHAGIRPEDGRSAIAAAARAVAALRLGRIDEETTANVGTIEGGNGSTNVVPERCRFLAEARSLSDGKVEDLVAEMVERIHEASNAVDCDVDADVVVERLFQGYRTAGSSPAVLAAEAALQACGYDPRRISTGGGSDANALEVSGFHCVNLANGTERNHEPTERVSVAALDGMLDVTYALVDELGGTDR
ncbi:MAG: tripeptide aminopeptidase [Solirubrobacteraceae bacterium]|nr:tripeptide aminopeptidase [Solirubrobacteraceae bacterium]